MYKDVYIRSRIKAALNESKELQKILPSREVNDLIFHLEAAKSIINKIKL